MRGLILGLALALSACQAAPTPREGRPTGLRTPQAIDQCQAQPDLDWCHARR